MIGFIISSTDKNKNHQFTYTHFSNYSNDYQKVIHQSKISVSFPFPYFLQNQNNYSLLIQNQMIFNRPKQSKSETPTRPIQPFNKITPLLGVNKKSDPFLKELKEVYDKENIHPNLKETRTKSYNNKPENTASQNRSPIKRIMNLKNGHKNTNNLAPTNKITKDNDALNSHSKYSQSTQFQKNPNKNKNSNRKSTQKDDAPTSHFQDEYYPSKQQRRQKKMKVTLKDIKKQRKSIQQSDGQYLSKGDTRQSISVNSFGKMQSTKVQFIKNQNILEQMMNSGSHTKEQNKNWQYYCLNHNEKKATHQLIDSVSCQQQNYCSKCAVDLATKGYQITQIVNHDVINRKFDVRQERIAQIKDFLFQIDKMEPNFTHNQQKMQSYKSFLKTKFDEDHQKLNIYYDNLMTVIKNSYISSQNHLKLYHSAILQQIQGNITSVNYLFQQISILKTDIIPNINKIIQQAQVQQQSFKIVIQNHYNRLKQIQFQINQISNYSCDFYQFKFENIEHLLIDLRNTITPVLERQHFDYSFQTERKSTLQSQEKWLDPFRMSFGKNNNSAYRL